MSDGGRDESIPRIEDLECPCGGAMLPNPGYKFVCPECGRSGEVDWRWHDE
jgi:predicted RNA-binding Zn-ribbon protein involved in translation (DUF1610 family)